MSETLSYPSIQKFLHWMVALVVIFMVPVGIIIDDFGNKPAVDELLGKGGFDRIYDLHKNFGLVLLLLMAVRLFVRAVLGKPRYYPELRSFEKIASAVVHWALYALLIATPLIGWLAISAYPALPSFFGLFKVPGIVGPDRALAEQAFALHRPLGLLIGLLAILHILAALYHGLIRRDGVFSRMLR